MSVNSEVINTQQQKQDIKQFKAKQVIGTDERGWVILELDTTKPGEYWKRVDQYGEFPKGDAELFASAPSLLAQRDALTERVKALTERVKELNVALAGMVGAFGVDFYQCQFTELSIESSTINQARAALQTK